MTEQDTVTRFSRRRLLTRLRALRPWFIAAAAVAVLGFAAWVVLWSSWLAAEDVSVVGDRTISTATVEQAADVSLGTPLVRLDLDQIRDRVSALPAVQSVTVHRSWPHTVSIAITERSPVATLRRDGAWWMVDSEGIIFRKTGERDKDVPVIAVPKKAGPDAVREAATVVDSLPTSLLAQTKRLTAASMDSITLRMKNKSSVLWGSSTESDRKVEVLEALLKDVRATQYNVSVPEQPTTSK
jgi:cell division protein FtsQ